MSFVVPSHKTTSHKDGYSNALQSPYNKCPSNLPDNAEASIEVTWQFNALENTVILVLPNAPERHAV